MVRLPVHWESVEHQSTLGQLNAQSLELGQSAKLKRSRPQPASQTDPDENAA